MFSGPAHGSAAWPRLNVASGQIGGRIAGDGPCASGRPREPAAGHSSTFYLKTCVYDTAHSGSASRRKGRRPHGAASTPVGRRGPLGSANPVHRGVLQTPLSPPTFQPSSAGDLGRGRLRDTTVLLPLVGESHVRSSTIIPPQPASRGALARGFCSSSAPSGAGRA